MAGYTSETWAPLNGPIAQHVHLQSQMCLLAYQVNPSLVLEHANIERATAQGGYGRRQLYELVQNGADALIGSTGIIHVVLTDDALYCANEGMPIDEEGATALLQSYISMKRGQEIGRFGLGFKSVLGVTDCPEFYSRSGSFVFDARASEREIRAVVGNVDRVPFLRIAQAVDAAVGAQADPILEELMEWATTIVKLPGGARSAPWLIDDIVSFPGEFLLFVPHVSELVLEDRRLGTVREIRLTEAGDEFVLSEPGSTASWKVFHTRHAPSEKARGDAGELAEREDIPIVWAVPMEGQLREGAFWAFFPDRVPHDTLRNTERTVEDERGSAESAARRLQQRTPGRGRGVDRGRNPELIEPGRPVASPRPSAGARPRGAQLGRRANQRRRISDRVATSVPARPEWHAQVPGRP